jgi:hypothetical protein
VPVEGQLASVAHASGSRIASAAETLSETMFSESAFGYRRSGIVLLTGFVTLAAIFAIFGAPSLAGGPWDMVCLLDGGWRILSGQVPHAGFHVPVGSLTYLLAAFGMKIVAPSASSLAYGSVLFAALLLPCAWYIVSARLPWVFTSIFVLFEGFLLLTPRPLGYPIRYTTYAMIYNRQGYALIILFLLCVFLKPRNSIGGRVLFDGMLAGALLALMLYCKITYFFVAAALALFAVILNAKPGRWFFAFAGAFTGVCAGFFAFFHINLYLYALDIIAAGRVQSPGMRTTLLSQALQNNALWIYMIVFCLGLCTLAGSARARQDLSAFQLWIVTGSIVGAGLLLASGNANQGGGVDDPMYFLAAVIFLELFRRQNTDKAEQSHTKARWAYTASWALMIPILCGTILARDVASCAYAVKWDLRGRPTYDPSQRMHSANLRDFYISPSVWKITAYWPARDFPARINDGIDLLRKNLQKDDRVTTVDYANPFSFALALPPANDALLFWDVNFSFDQLHFPPPKDFLGSASLVMVPRLADRSLGCCFQTPDLMLGIYGGYLHSHFHEIASTETWVLYRRNPD